MDVILKLFLDIISTDGNESIILHEMKQNGLEYEKIEKLMSIQSRKENCKYASFINEKN